jgi:TetR/AcrR family transcriptional regulator, cholesterol catabolism regulator
MKNTDKRSEIIAAALKLFSSTHNVNKVSLEAIAAEAHVSPTTIYNNFQDRDTLVYEVVKELARVNIERNKAIVHSNLPFPQKLISIISGKMDMTDKVNSEIIEKMLGQDKKIGPFIDDIFEHEIKPLWTEIMADGKKQGYVDPTLDEKALVMYLYIMEAGLKSRTEIFKDIKENMGLLANLTHIMFYGFLKKEIDLFKKEGK